MNTIKAHVFQHRYNGSQLFIYHCKDEIQARSKVADSVLIDEKWIFLGIKKVLL